MFMWIAIQFYAAGPGKILSSAYCEQCIIFELDHRYINNISQVKKSIEYCFDFMESNFFYNQTFCK